VPSRSLAVLSIGSAQQRGPAKTGQLYLDTSLYVCSLVGFPESKAFLIWLYPGCWIHLYKYSYSRAIECMAQRWHLSHFVGPHRRETYQRDHVTSTPMSPIQSIFIDNQAQKKTQHVVVTTSTNPPTHPPTVPPQNIYLLQAPGSQSTHCAPWLPGWPASHLRGTPRVPSKINPKTPTRHPHY